MIFAQRVLYFYSIHNYIWNLGLDQIRNRNLFHIFHQVFLHQFLLMDQFHTISVLCQGFISPNFGNLEKMWILALNRKLLGIQLWNDLNGIKIVFPNQKQLQASQGKPFQLCSHKKYPHRNLRTSLALKTKFSWRQFWDATNIKKIYILKAVLRSETFVNDFGFSKFVFWQYWFHTCSETETFDSSIAEHVFQCISALWNCWFDRRFIFIKIE